MNAERGLESGKVVAADTPDVRQPTASPQVLAAVELLHRHASIVRRALRSRAVG
jgi:hypothetical protein